MFLALMALVDVVKREVDNIPIAFLFLTGTAVSIIEGPQWNWWNFAPTVVALFAYGFYQIGGADAKVLIALTPMPGPWIPWFLVTAFILTIPLHLFTKKPPLLVAYAASLLILIAAHLRGVTY